MNAINAALTAAVLALGLVAGAHARDVKPARPDPKAARPDPKPVRPEVSKGIAPADAASPEADRADIDRTAIVGNRELPKVLHIVPWKKPVPGELSGRPVSSVLDEALAPIDRDVFRRQIDYDAQARAQTTRRHEPAPAR